MTMAASTRSQLQDFKATLDAIAAGSLLIRPKDVLTAEFIKNQVTEATVAETEAQCPGFWSSALAAHAQASRALAACLDLAKATQVFELCDVFRVARLDHLQGVPASDPALSCLVLALLRGDTFSVYAQGLSRVRAFVTAATDAASGELSCLQCADEGPRSGPSTASAGAAAASRVDATAPNSASDGAQRSPAYLTMKLQLLGLASHRLLDAAVMLLGICARLGHVEAVRHEALEALARSSVLEHVAATLLCLDQALATQMTASLRFEDAAGASAAAGGNAAEPPVVGRAATDSDAGAGAGAAGGTASQLPPPLPLVHWYDALQAGLRAARPAVLTYVANAAGSMPLMLSVRRQWWAGMDAAVRLFVLLRRRQAAARLPALWQQFVAMLPALPVFSDGSSTWGTGGGCSYSLRCALDAGLLPALEQLLRRAVAGLPAVQQPPPVDATARFYAQEQAQVACVVLGSLLCESGVWSEVLAHGSAAEAVPLVATLSRVAAVVTDAAAAAAQTTKDVGALRSKPEQRLALSVCLILTALLEQQQAQAAAGGPSRLLLQSQFDVHSDGLALSRWVCRNLGGDRDRGAAARLLLADWAALQWLPVLLRAPAVDLMASGMSDTALPEPLDTGRSGALLVSRLARSLVQLCRHYLAAVWRFSRGERVMGGHPYPSSMQVAEQDIEVRAIRKAEAEVACRPIEQKVAQLQQRSRRVQVEAEAQLARINPRAAAEMAAARSLVVENEAMRAETDALQEQLARARAKAAQACAGGGVPDYGDGLVWHLALGDPGNALGVVGLEAATLLDGPSALLPPGAGKVCARCKGVRYCCGACQLEHWRQRGGHSEDCAGMKAKQQAASAGK
eukprot:XP_001692809.1 predicted protein [Chlamydomonas reinhardtii]